MGCVSSMFGGGSDRPKPLPPPVPPPLPAPTPIPVEPSGEGEQKARDKRRQRIVSAGRQGTILTAGQSLSSGSATLLGRST